MRLAVTPDLQRRWMEAWRTAGPALEDFKREELQAMTEEQARAISESLLSSVPSPHDWRADPLSSGFVEQQRIFARARS